MKDGIANNPTVLRRTAAQISKVAVTRTLLCLPTSGARESNMKTAAALCKLLAVILSVLIPESEPTWSTKDSAQSLIIASVKENLRWYKKCAGGEKP